MNSHQRRLTILSIKKWLLRSQNQMQGAFQQNHICYFSVIWACRPAARRVRRRVESIYSRRSEEPKTVCQRKPTAPLVLSSTERLHKKPFACLPTALRAEPTGTTVGFSSTRNGIDIFPGPAL